MDLDFFAFALATSLTLAGGGLLILIGYIGTVPAAFADSLKTGLITLALPLIGPVWFAYQRGPEFRVAVYQLIGGLLLVVIAGGLILGLGPYFAERLAGELIEAARQR